MSDFDTQINVGMNVEGVVTGTEKAKRSLKDLNTSARESGKSIDGMGDGGSKAADKVEAATRSMIGSIQRQTAALEAGDKSSRKYQESLAKMRGIDVGALKPYLDQLDAAKMKQDIAANSQKGLIGGFGGISTAALGAATAFVAVAAGVATMTKKVVDGLDALNDLKDATGASIENISAIEDVALRTGASFDVVSTSLIKLNQGLNNAKPGSDTENAINAIGLSVKDLKALDPAEAFRQIAVGLSGFADDANKARLTQELFGKSLKEVAPLLNDLAAAGSLVATVTAKEAEEAEKFNKELFNLSKTALDAARDMAGPLVSAINETIQLFREGAKEGKSFYSVLVDEQLRLLGLKDGPKEYAKRLNDISRELESGNIHQTKRNALLREQAAIQAKFSATPVTSYEETELARLARAPKPTVGNLPDQAAIKAAAAASAKALAELNKELAAQTKLLAENAGLTGTFANDWDRLAAIYKKGGVSLEQLSEAQAKLLADQPAIKAAKDAEVKAAELIEKANKAAFESRLKHVESLGSGLDKLQEEVNKQAEYNDRLGLTKEAIAELDAAKLELQATDLDSIAIKKLDRDLDEEQYDLYKKQAAELRNLARLKRVGGEKEAALEVVKATNEEWKRGWEETDRLVRDVFTTWATDGSNAAQKIGDTLKKALLSAIYEATIKPIALQLYTSIAGGGGAAGAVQGASNALSGGSSLLSGLSSVTGAFGSSMSANFGATMSSFGSTIGLSIEGGLASIAEGTAASVASGLGSIAGALGPVAVGIGALSALKSAMDYKVEANGNAIVANLGGGSTVVANRNDYTQTGGLFGGGTTQNSEWRAASAELTAYMDAQVKLVTESARAYGTALGLPVADLDSFKQQIEVSLTGLNADQATKAINEAIAGFGNAMASANFGPTLDAFKQKGEASGDTLKRLATEITTVNSTLGMLGGKLLSVDAAGIKAANGLVQAMGGLEAFQQQTASYYNDYYTEEEKRLNTAKDIQSQLANAGIEVSLQQVLDGTKEQFRALVESFTNSGIDLGAAGQEAVAALMAVAGAFAKIAKVEVPTASAAVTGPVVEGNNAGQGGGMHEVWSNAYGNYWDPLNEKMDWLRENYFESWTLIKDHPLTKLMQAKTMEQELAELKEQLRVSQLSAEELAAEEAAKAQAALEFVSPENLEVYKEILAIKEQLGQGSGSQSSAAQERETLQNEYNQLTMTSVELRALEREKIAESNRELWDKIQLLKDQKLAEQATQDYKLQTLALMGEAGAAELKALQQSIDDKAKLEAGWTQQQIDSLHQLQAASEATAQAAEAAAKALELQKHELGLQATLYELTGDKAAARAVLEAQRAIELAAMDPSLRELQQQVWGLQDAAKASSEALSAAQANANEAMAALRRAVDAQRKIYQVQVDAAQEAVNEIKSVFDILHSSVKDLYGSVDSTAKMQSKEARAFITQALGTAQATGYLPESKQLQEAIAAAKGGNDEFASQFEKDFAALTLAGDLSQMELIAGRQLTEAQRMLNLAEDQLSALDAILETAQAELDAANGINTSVLSVADAVKNLNAAILALAGAQRAKNAEANVSGIASEYLSSVSGTNGSSTYTSTELAAFSSEQSAFQLLANIYGQASQARANRGEAWAETFASNDPYLATVGKELAALAAYYTKHPVSGPASGASWLHALGIGSYDIGTNYVTSDQIAKIHKGEAIIPRAYNPAAGGQTGNARLESLVEGLTKEVQRLQAIVNDGNKSNERIATAVNGNPDRPVPIDVLENSAGLATA